MTALILYRSSSLQISCSLLRVKNIAELSCCNLLQQILSSAEETLNWALQAFSKQPRNTHELYLKTRKSSTWASSSQLSLWCYLSCLVVGQWRTLISDNDLSILVASYLPSGEGHDILTRVCNNIYHDYLVFSAQ